MSRENTKVAQSKSAVDKLRSMTFSKRDYTYSPSQYHSLKSLENDRRETQEEISKLSVIIEDPSIELNDEEIMDVNDEINRLIEMKRRIENEIYSVSEGKVSYGTVTGPAAMFKFFGRAKDVKRKQAAETEAGLEKRKVFQIKEVSETNKEEIIKEKLKVPEEISSKAKRTRFDDVDDED